LIFAWKNFVYYVCFVQWKMMVLHFHHQALDVFGIHLSTRGNKRKKFRNRFSSMNLQVIEINDE
jgi:hypothetical protein